MYMYMYVCICIRALLQMSCMHYMEFYLFEAGIETILHYQK